MHFLHKANRRTQIVEQGLQVSQSTVQRRLEAVAAAAGSTKQSMAAAAHWPQLWHYRHCWLPHCGHCWAETWRVTAHGRWHLKEGLEGLRG